MCCKNNNFPPPFFFFNWQYNMLVWAEAHIESQTPFPALSYCNPVSGRHEAQMLWGASG